MKKTLLLLCFLLSVFAIEWGVKARMPIGRPDNTENTDELPSYLQAAAPQPSEDWILGSEKYPVPPNYIPVPGSDNIFMIVDNDGKVKEYKKGIKQSDGSYKWYDVDPNIPEDYEPVPGLKNVYKVTAEDGTVTYVKYIRNKDNSYAFVRVNKDGTAIDEGKDAKEVDTKHYKHLSKDEYAVYDDNGVLIGYRKRVKDDKGNWVWREIDQPTVTKPSSDNNTDLADIVGKGKKKKSKDNADQTQNGYSGENITAEFSDSGKQTKTVNSDGTYTITTTEIITENGKQYKTVTTMVYRTSDNELISSKVSDPVLVGEVKTPDKLPVADTSKVKGTLDKELNRVSASVDFNETKANDVLNKLNAQRKKNGLSSLKMDTDSTVYKLACVRAADMAIYDHGSTTSPMYGSLNDMCTKWNISSISPAENIWKARERSASDIHDRFQALEDARNLRMSSSKKEVGIAIVDKDGKSYIAEIYLQ